MHIKFTMARQGCAFVRFIGWLKNFISDRNHATENLVDRYIAVTFTRRAPSDLRACLLARWDESGLKTPARSFLFSTAAILARSRGMSGQRIVTVKLTSSSSRQHIHPKPELRDWFDAVSPHLQIRVLARGCVRKNGRRIVHGEYVAYNKNGSEHVGVVHQVFIGVQASEPYVHIASVCEVLEIPAARITVVKSRDSRRRLLMVAKSTRGEHHVLVDTRDLRWMYHRAASWDVNKQDCFALVRFERL